MPVVAMVECSAGNDSVGTMWIQTRVFNTSEPIANVMRWVETLSSHCIGKVILRTPDNASEIKVENFTSPNKQSVAQS